MPNTRLDRKSENPASIRFILTGSCQSGCDFCHLEGNRPFGYSVLHPDISSWKEKDPNLPILQRLSYPADLADVDFIIKLGHLLKINQVHLTGGEPTLHPSLIDIISKFKQERFLVDFTTHGEYPTSLLSKLLSLQIDGAVFSLHCVSPEEYLSMDLVAQQTEEKFGLEKAIEYSTYRLSMKKNNIQLALGHQKKVKGFDVRANHVIRNSATAISVIRFCNEIGLRLRLQKDLNRRSESARTLEEVMSLLNAVKVDEKDSVYDSSDHRIIYQYRLKNGQKGEFQVKDFSPVYLPFICQNCELKGTNQCRERFYGIRVQHGHVRLCIDRHDKKVLYDFRNFLENKCNVLDELKRQYRVD